MKNVNFKIFHNLVIFRKIANTPTEEKRRFLDPEKILLKKVSINSGCPKICPGTGFRPPKRQGTKK